MNVFVTTAAMTMLLMDFGPYSMIFMTSVFILYILPSILIGNLLVACMLYLQLEQIGHFNCQARQCSLKNYTVSYDCLLAR